MLVGKLLAILEGSLNVKAKKHVDWDGKCGWGPSLSNHRADLCYLRHQSAQHHPFSDLNPVGLGGNTKNPLEHLHQRPLRLRHFAVVVVTASIPPDDGSERDDDDVPVGESSRVSLIRILAPVACWRVLIRRMHNRAIVKENVEQIENKQQLV